MTARGAERREATAVRLACAGARSIVRAAHAASCDRTRACALAAAIGSFLHAPGLTLEAASLLRAAIRAQMDATDPEAAERRRAAEWKRALDASRREVEAWRALAPEARAAIEAGAA